MLSGSAPLPACDSDNAWKGWTVSCVSGGTAQVKVAPEEDRSVLWVAAYDAAGNVSTASPVALVNWDGSCASLGGTTNLHQWTPSVNGFTSTTPVTVPDPDAATPVAVNLGSSLSTTVTSSNGQSSGAVLSFPGATTADQVAATATAGVLDTTAPFSVSAWVNPATVTDTMAIVAQSGASNSGFVLEDVKGHMTFCVTTQPPAATQTDCATDSATQNPGQWVMVTGIWDPVNHQLRVIIGSDAKVATVAAHTPPTKPATVAGVITIGTAQANGALTTPWTGKIASVEVVQEVVGTSFLQSTWHNLFS